jgi:hypothetical protein
VGDVVGADDRGLTCQLIALSVRSVLGTGLATSLHQSLVKAEAAIAEVLHRSDHEHSALSRLE